MAKTGVVVVLGDFSDERLDLESAAHEFGWSVYHASDVSALEAVWWRGDIVAVLIHTRTCDAPWARTLKAVQAAVPWARTVICHGVQETYSWPEMIHAGAFFVLLAPLDRTEVRRALGFIWASRRSLSRALPSSPKQPPLLRAGAA